MFLTYRPGARIPSETDFVGLLAARGLEATVARYHQLRGEYPQLAVIRYSVLNRLAYRLKDDGKADLAISAFRLNAAACPSLADAFDRLADGYLAKGDSASARRAYERVLVVLPADTSLSASTREELKQRAEDALRTSR